MDSKAATATDSKAGSAMDSKTTIATESKAGTTLYIKPPTAMDLIQSGTVTTWDDSVLSVTKREGNSLEGVTIATKLWTGEIDTLTADTATFSNAPSAKDTVILNLHNAKMKSGKSVADLGDLQTILKK